MRKKGFTLVELIVVMFIVGILIALVGKGCKAVNISMAKVKKVNSLGLETVYRGSKMTPTAYNPRTREVFRLSVNYDSIAALMGKISDEVDVVSWESMDYQSKMKWINKNGEQTPKKPEKKISRISLGLDKPYELRLLEGRIVTIKYDKVEPKQIVFNGIVFWPSNGDKNSHDYKLQNDAKYRYIEDTFSHTKKGTK